MKIDILGTGCPKCEQLASNARAAIDALGIEADIVKVTDIVEIADRGVLLTPALAIDGETKLAGKLATVEEIKSFLS